MPFAPKKILVATDFSSNAQLAADHAAAVAKSFGAELTLLHIVPLGTYVDFANHMESQAVNQTDFRKAVQAKIQGDSTKEVDRLRALGITVHFATTDGQPASEISRYAKENAFDLVVVGTHGRTGLARVLLGSVAEGVIRECAMPVLTIRTSPA